jgi:hypothetical protein
MFVAAMAPVVPLPCPITTLAPAVKPVPVIVIGLPPVLGPELGDSALTVGGRLPRLAAKASLWPELCW